MVNVLSAQLSSCIPPRHECSSLLTTRINLFWHFFPLRFSGSRSCDLLVSRIEPRPVSILSPKDFGLFSPAFLPILRIRFRPLYYISHGKRLIHNNKHQLQSWATVQLQAASREPLNITSLHISLVATTWMLLLRAVSRISLPSMRVTPLLLR